MTATLAAVKLIQRFLAFRGHIKQTIPSHIMATKFFSLLFATSLGLVASAQAQSADQVVAAPSVTVSENTRQAAAELTREMSSRLKLSEGQYIRLYEVNKTRVAQVAQIERNFQADPETKASRMAELDAQYQQECGRILTPSQLSQLQGEKNTQPTTTPTGTGNGIG